MLAKDVWKILQFFKLRSQNLQSFLDICSQHLDNSVVLPQRFKKGNSLMILHKQKRKVLFSSSDQTLFMLANADNLLQVHLRAM